MNTQITHEFDSFFASEQPPVTGVSPHVVSAQNDRDGLEAIHKFGWLRAREIGNVLWGRNPSRHIAGARIARKWLKSGLVMSRTLPWGHGPAFVLTKAGADFLFAEFGIQASSGKKIGDHIKGQTIDCWRPTLSWQHDLIANSFLTLCMGHGYRVFTELEISRRFPNAPKIPDGLFEYINQDGTKEWIAIEIERANKYSSDKRNIIKSILQAQLNGGIEFGNILVKNIYLVYHDPLLFDEKGQKPPDHFSRLKRAIEGSLHPTQKILLVGLPVLLKGGAVIEIREPIVTEVGYGFDEMVQRLARPDEWPFSHGRLAAFWSNQKNRSPYHLDIENIPDTKNWIICISYDIEGEWKTRSESVLNLTEQGAKEAAIRKLANFSKFRSWVYEKHVGIPNTVLSVDDL